jgi:hypothetical protein
VEGPPPNKDDEGKGLMAGPGKGVAAGRGMPLMPSVGHGSSTDTGGSRHSWKAVASDQHSSLYSSMLPQIP